MATAARPVRGYYAGLVAIILSAVGASTAVFFLFDSFLEKLVPPDNDFRQTVAFASFGTAIVLLILSLAIQKRLTESRTRTVALTCGVLLFLAVLLFVYFRDMTRTYVYRFPPRSQAEASQKLHIRGDFHERGRALIGGKTTSQTVYELGGPDYVNGQGILWTEESRLSRIAAIEWTYIALAMLLTTTLFTAALALWRVGRR